MSQANPAFPGRNVYASSSSKLPDRTGQKPAGVAPSQHYSQSAFGRRADQTHPFNQSLAPQQQHGAQGARQSMEKEPNVLSELSEEQREEINEAFSLFDLDRDQHLNYQEARIALRSLGFTIPRPEISQIMHTHGVPKPQFKRGLLVKGQTTYHASQLLLPQSAFQRIAAQRIFERDPGDEVERAFLLFDPQQRGYIEAEDIRRVARELGETGLEDDEIQAMIDMFDYDGTGTVSKEAFYTICLQ
ncbi:uncharacterized protein PV06_03084 [Exophiala oligosperma]|uniref:Calmodulin n=2 Tax=Chaetothyriales TaxID=34395 RepID=A0A0D2E9K6_9EURO|nr:uncharacterized protein PV06_03084 [Exophiala oligosperma]KAJ9639635.1 Calcium-binding component of the spindle pole body (SPB) half-bridge [Knufia peltigerae]KIW44629.1 hypothetical protein PV06_03084 [Exophiala oligosperma]